TPCFQGLSSLSGLADFTGPRCRLQVAAGPSSLYLVPELRRYGSISLRTDEELRTARVSAHLQQITLDVSNRPLSVAVRESAPLLALSFAQWPVPSRLWSRALRFRPRPGTFLQSHQSFPELGEWQQTLASNILCRQASSCRSSAEDRAVEACVSRCLPTHVLPGCVSPSSEHSATRDRKCKSSQYPPL